MDSLDFVELEMKAGGFLDFAVELKNPDFPALAESAGILGLKAETAQDVRPMLQKAFKHDGPALVEVLVLRRDGQDRNAAAMSIIKSIDEMQVTWPAATRAHGQVTVKCASAPAAKAAVSSCRTGTHLMLSRGAD